MCFFPGMDTYFKIWLQLAFPAYVIIFIGSLSHHYQLLLHQILKAYRKERSSGNSGYTNFAILCKASRNLL